jgi:NitT/TauT family transport system substrate-binding protein
VNSVTKSCLFSLAALALGAAPAASEEVSVVVLPYLSQAPIFIAIEEGMFEREGITISRVDMKSSRPVVPGIMSGEFDMAMAVPTAGFYNAIDRGGKGRIVGPGVTFTTGSCEYLAYYGRKGFDRDSFTTGQEMKVNLSADAITFEGYLSGLMNKMPGAEKLSFEFLEMPAYTQGDALQAGSIDVAFTAEPWVTRFNDAGLGQVTMGASEILPDGQFGTLMFSARLADTDPALGVRVKRAMDAAISQYNEGKTARNLEILASYTGLSVDVVNRACWASVPNDGAVRAESLMAYQNWLVANDIIDRVISVDEMIVEIAK